MTTEYKGVAVWHCDSEEEFDEAYNDLAMNPDFTLLGNFGMVQEVYYELEYQGFTEEQLDQFTHYRFGTCLEIKEFASDYVAFFGTR